MIRGRGGLTWVRLEGQLVGGWQVAQVLEGPGQGQVVGLRGRGQDVHPLASVCGGGNDMWKERGSGPQEMSVNSDV